jgi:hypothetical protein
MIRLGLTSRFLKSIAICALMTVGTRAGQEQQAQEKQVSTDADGSARLYVYRYNQYVGKAIRPSIYCDGREVARIQSGRFVELIFKPGTHEFWSSDDQARIHFDMKPGQTYYVRVEIATGLFKGHGRLVMTQPEQGEPELKKLKPVDKDMVKDTALLPAGFLTR